MKYVQGSAQSLSAIAMFLALLAWGPAARAHDILYQGPDNGSWNVFLNWNTGAPPHVAFNEAGVINNSATVVLSEHTKSDLNQPPIPPGFDANIGGLRLGSLASTSGGLRITSGGILEAVPHTGTLTPPETGAIAVGGSGQGNLTILGNGLLTGTSLSLGGTSGSSITLSDTATLNVSDTAMLGRTTTIIGPNVNFSAGGNLSLSGTSILVADIRNATTHSKLVTQGTANVGGTLKPKFTGVTPAAGNKWTLIDAPTTINGTFSTIDTSLAPALPTGQSYGVFQENVGGRRLLQLAVEEILTLQVNRNTGAVTIANVGAQPKSLDGYSILSAHGSLTGVWDSLQGRVAGWVEAGPTANALSELYPNLPAPGHTVVSAGGTLTLGTPYEVTVPELGVDPDDLTFEYRRSDERIVQGQVIYTGTKSLNNFVLTLDPATGQAQIKLDSPLDVAIDGYSIFSDSGSLTPAMWNSLQDQNVSGWEQAPPAPTNKAVAELRADGALEFQNNTGFALGQLFKTVGATQDLRFEFLLPGEEVGRIGTVVYGPITPVPPPSEGGTVPEPALATLVGIALMLAQRRVAGRRCARGRTYSLPRYSGGGRGWGPEGELVVDSPAPSPTLPRSTGGGRRGRRKSYTLLGAVALMLLALGVTAPSLASQLTPIDTTGHDADLIFENDASPAQNTELGSRWYFEQGLLSGTPPAIGLPAGPARTVLGFTSPITGNTIDYAFDDYGANNVVMFKAGTATKPLALAAPAKYEQLAVIFSGGSLSTTALLDYTIQYASGATQAGTIGVTDWGGGAGVPAGSARFLVVDRANLGPVLDSSRATATRWNIFVSEITILNPSLTINRIDFSTALSGASDVAVFGLAGLARDAILGDTDGDGVVELEDFEPIRANFRKVVSLREQGDLVRDFVVDFEDFGQWKAAFLGGGGSLEGVDLSFTQVPEPNALWLAMAGLVGAMVRRRRIKGTSPGTQMPLTRPPVAGRCIRTAGVAGIVGALAASAQAATVLLVGGSSGGETESELRILLQNMGHLVPKPAATFSLAPPTVSDLAEVDLIFVTRSADSADYDDVIAGGAEPALWNSINKPMLLMSPQIARGSSDGVGTAVWGWLGGNTLVNNQPAPTNFNSPYPNPAHPFVAGRTTDVFPAGVTIDLLNTLSVPAGATTVTTLTSGANTFAGIVDYPAGTTLFFDAQGTQSATPARRAFLHMYDYPDMADQAFELTANGNQILNQIINTLAPTTTVPGDVNGSGVTDINDYIIIRNNFNTSGKTRAQGDLNGDGNVDFADFRRWKDSRTDVVEPKIRQWFGADLANWNTDANWMDARQPDALLGESAAISNNTTALLAGPSDLDVAGLLLGHGPADAGGLRIASGGRLNVIPSTPGIGAIEVGNAGRGNLSILGGGTLSGASLSLSGDPDSTIALGDGSGLTATLTVGGSANLNRTTTVIGPNVNFSAGGNLTLGASSTLVADIRHAALHSPLKSESPATVSGTLRPIFTGVTPRLGSKWTLIDAATSITGSFNNLDLSMAPPLRSGLRYDVLRSTSGNRELRHLSVVPVAYEPFDYSSTGPNLPSVAGGSGFSSAWAPASGNAAVIYGVAAESLSGDGGLMVDGNRLAARASPTQIASLTRRLAQPMGLPGETRFLSFVLRPEGTLHEGAFNGFFGLYLDRLTGTELFIGKPGGGALSSFVLENVGGAQQHPSSTTAVVGQEYLLVLRADFADGIDNFVLYVNPEPGGSEPLTGTIKRDIDVGLIVGLSLYSTGAFSIDEIRIGTDYSDVVPRFDQDRIWGVDANGNTSLASNWAGGVAPGGIDQRVIFGDIITANRTVSVDASFTAGSLIFDDNNNYLVQGPGAITLDVSSGVARIDVKNLNGAGSHTISAPLSLADNTTIDVVAGSALNITSQMSAAGVAITKSGAGTLSLRNIRAAALSINAGSVRVLPNGSADGTSVLTSLTVTAGALDLTNNDLIIDNGNLAAVTALIADNRLVSTSAIPNTTLGVILNGTRFTTFSGQAVDPTDVLVKFTYFGDANFDGRVSIADFLAADRGFARNLAGWGNGDFDLSGVIDGGDFFLIDQAFLAQGFPLTSLAPPAATVPEPGLLLLLCSLVLPLRRRR